MPEDLRTRLASDRADLLRIGGVLGILTESPKRYFESEKQKKLGRSSVDSETVERLIEERAQARIIKNWSKADAIRKQLEEMNVILEDKPEGTVWKISG
jgi:cysteinyl-tRNA synthetase